MMCDLLIAADTAKFWPARDQARCATRHGRSQRLTRAIGKAKAMDLILTGRTIDAAEAERSGLVSRVVPPKICSTRPPRWPPPSPRCRGRLRGWPRRP